MPTDALAIHTWMVQGVVDTADLSPPKALLDEAPKQLAKGPGPVPPDGVPKAALGACPTEDGRLGELPKTEVAELVAGALLPPKPKPAVGDTVSGVDLSPGARQCM